MNKNFKTIGTVTHTHTHTHRHFYKENLDNNFINRNISIRLFFPMHFCNRQK